PLRQAAAALALALAGALAPVAQAQPMRMPGGPPGPMMMLGGPHHMDHALAAVGATPEQVAQVRSIMKAAHADLKAMHEGGESLHAQARQLFSQPVVDPAAAEALRQKMQARDDAASKRMMQAMIAVSQVLTAEQRVQLMANAAAMHERMEAAHHHGPHGPQAPASGGAAQ
ncbi:MAG: periplasmic heavy metal sensor, partial [Burkholderiales bacterium]|nr:periplasmic heavy metal sensor [Burkholderiales bacterium]